MNVTFEASECLRHPLMPSGKAVKRSFIISYGTCCLFAERSNVFVFISSIHPGPGVEFTWAAVVGERVAPVGMTTSSMLECDGSTGCVSASFSGSR